MSIHKTTSSTNKLVVVSILYFMISLFMFTLVTFAWFTLTNVNRANLLVDVSAVEAEYEFFVYMDENYSGSPADTLIDNICTIDEMDCYMQILNPAVVHLIPNKVAPGDRFSFAIRITSLGSSNGKLRMDLGNLQSLGAPQTENRIQRAFEYGITSVVYFHDNLETEDQKDNGTIVYHVDYFRYDHNGRYPLISDVIMGPRETAEGVIIVFFDLYFDPTIHGVDGMGESLGNSNIFMNQQFVINRIFMELAPL